MQEFVYEKIALRWCNKKDINFCTHVGKFKNLSHAFQEYRLRTTGFIQIIACLFDPANKLYNVKSLWVYIPLSTKSSVHWQRLQWNWEDTHF